MVVNKDLARPVLTRESRHVVDRLGEVRVRVKFCSAAPAGPAAVLPFDHAKEQSALHGGTFRRARSGD